MSCQRQQNSLKQKHDKSLCFVQNENLNTQNSLNNTYSSSNSLLPSKNYFSQTFNSLQPVEHYCSQNDGRKASFVLNHNNHSLWLCQKCAIIAASKALPVQKIPPLTKMHQKNNTTMNKYPVEQMNDSQLSLQLILRQKEQADSSSSDCNNQLTSSTSASRQDILSVLNYKVYRSQQQLQRKYSEVEQLLEVSGEMYGQLIEQVTKQFKILQQMIEYQKHLIYNKILNERVKNQKDVKELKEYIQNTIQEINKIHQDLNQNQDVVFTVQHNQFQFIIQTYFKTVEHTQDIIDLKPEILTYKQVQFPQNLSQINQLLATITQGFKLQHQHLWKVENLKIANYKDKDQNQQDKTQYQEELNPHLYEEQDNDILRHLSGVRDLNPLINPLSQSNKKLKQHSISLQKRAKALISSKNTQINQSWSPNIEDSSIVECSVENSSQEEEYIEFDPAHVQSQSNIKYYAKTPKEQNIIHGNSNMIMSSNSKGIMGSTSKGSKNLNKPYKLQSLQQLPFNQESLTQYFIIQDSLPLNRTINQKSETFLLNH